MAAPLLQLHKGSKAYGDRELMNEASFAVNDGEHVGVIGPNGAGKSTLFKALTGRIELDKGDIIKSHSLRIGYLEQEETWDTSWPVMRWLEEETGEPEWRLTKLLTDFGFTQEQVHLPLSNFSGGYRMRVKLTALLASEPNLLLLDEPTNYLDLETLVVLENFLLDWKGAFMLISHDREFLKRVTDHTLEIEAGDINKFPGNIEDYFEQKEQLRDLLMKQASSIEARRKTIIDFANRFGAKATKAKQVQSRLKSLDKMESISIKPLPSIAQIPIPAPARTSKETLMISDGRFGYADHVVLNDVTFRLLKGDHLAVVGTNGAGKSTLLKSLAGVLPKIAGDVQTGFGVTFGYFAQHLSEALDNSDTVLGELQRAAHPDVKPQEILDLAGSLLFSGEDVHKKISILSGGERTRVALGQILLKKCSCLLLDEPTNHLDFQTVEALTLSLQRFEGTLLVVSHDRSFVKGIADKILEIRNGEALFYPGSYDEYVWSVQKGVMSHGPEESRSTFGGETTSAKKPIGNYKQVKKDLEKQKKTAEKELRKLESDMEQTEQDLETATTELLKTQGSEATELSKKLSVLKDQLASLEESWVNTGQRLEKIESELTTLIGN